MSKRVITRINNAGKAKQTQAVRQSPNKLIKNFSVKAPKIVIGIDEVGRGALAGPVTVAAVALNWQMNFNQGPGKLRDSKKLTPEMRKKWVDYFSKNPELKWALCHITPKVIDKINISRAADKAALCAIKKLNPPTNGFFVYLDAGLRLPKSIPHLSVIKGDEKIKAVAAASIIAKVNRDRAMVKMHKKDSRYRFDIHKGYGTKLHREKIERFGLSSHHRLSFKLKQKRILKTQSQNKIFEIKNPYPGFIHYENMDI